MPKQSYVHKRFSSDRLDIINQANAIIEEYQAKGLSLTLRQLFYQFVSRDLIANTQREYKNLGETISDGRLAGLIDWLAIIDRTRELSKLPHWDDPSSILSSVAHQYREDKWATQPRRVEVWIEKDALIGVIEEICQSNDVPFLSCRGYTSQTEMWGAAQRLLEHIGNEQQVLILHLGDHDPSGIDMTRDIRDRLELFIGDRVEVKRLALNMDQVEEYEPPPNPAKVTDSRAAGYIDLHGRESWELDALDPQVLSDLIRDNIRMYRNAQRWAEAVKEENQRKEQLRKLSEQWEKVVKKLK